MAQLALQRGPATAWPSGEPVIVVAPRDPAVAGHRLRATAGGRHRHRNGRGDRARRHPGAVAGHPGGVRAPRDSAARSTPATCSCSTAGKGTSSSTPARKWRRPIASLQREYVELRDRLIDNRDQEPITRRRRPRRAAGQRQRPGRRRHGRHGRRRRRGLYRTEYLFLTHPSVPDEEEQLAAYRAVIEAAPNRTVTIRTLDLGRRQARALPRHAAPGQPVHGLAEHPPQLRLPRILPDAAAGHPAGRAVTAGSACSSR